MKSAKLEAIEKIALKCFQVKTLEEVGLDRYDFKEVHILDIKQALEEAYDAGFQEAEEHYKL
jgi:hypothetical protein